MPPTRTRYVRNKLNNCNHQNRDSCNCNGNHQQSQISTTTKNENQYSISAPTISSSVELPEPNNHCDNSNFVLPTTVHENSNDITENVKLNHYIKKESVDGTDNSEDIILETEEDDQFSTVEVKMSDSNEDNSLDTFDDEADLIVGFPMPKRIKKPARVRKSSAGKRNIQRHWSDDEIVKLIAAVEKRRPLWDIASPEYKSLKTDFWHEVGDELELGNVDIAEIKNKWSNLRVTFRTNMAKLQKKKSGDGTDDSTSVQWRHFKSMLFLEINDVHRSTSSTSTSALENAMEDSSWHNDFPEPSQSLAMPSVSKQKCQEARMPNSIVSTSSANTSTADILKTAMSALQTSDINSTFSDHILAELRSLSPANARSLRQALSKAMWKFFDELEPGA